MFEDFYEKVRQPLFMLISTIKPKKIKYTKKFVRMVASTVEKRTNLKHKVGSEGRQATVK